MKSGSPVEEDRVLAHVKRFMECWTADPEFRLEVKRSCDHGLSLARSRGIEINPKELTGVLSNGTDTVPHDEELRATNLGRRWCEYLDLLSQSRQRFIEYTQQNIAENRFRKWFSRQRLRVESELGPTAETCLVIAFELTEGCSVGCWFCGLDSAKLKGVFPHTPENRRLWRNTLRVCTEIFGAATQSGICYWATEPFDNPDYTKFMSDFSDIVGVMPATSTALPLKDARQTRYLIQTRLPHNSFPGSSIRFSLTSLRRFREVISVFSAEELLHVRLAARYRGSLQPMNMQGRLWGLKRSEVERTGRSISFVESATVACVAGFLVNMVTKRLKLVSPCTPSDRWPRGYRVHFEGTFSSADEFASLVMQAIETCMPESLRLNELVSFRPDLSYEREPAGFTLRSEHTATTIQRDRCLAWVGDRIHEAKHTPAGILDMTEDDMSQYSVVVRTLSTLFNKGLLADETILVTCPHVFNQS